MKILNGNEAFAALMAGKNILCRAVGDLIDFDDLDQFPATVFAKADYEFCIKIEMMELAGIAFTKPLMLEDIQVDQEVFMINTTGSILQGKFKPECDALVRAVKNGFVQRDSINAQSQAKALHALFGVEGVIQLKTIDFTNQSDEQIPSVKKRGAKKANNSTPAAANDASVPVEKKTFDSQSNIQITEQGPVTVVEDSLSDPIETDAVKLVEKFTAEINAAESVDAESTEDPVQLSQSMKMEYMVALTGATQLDAIAGLENEVNKDSRLLDNHKSILNTYIKTRRRVINEESKPTEIAEQAEPVNEHQEHLEILLNDIALAKTPIEANAQIKYTKSWTQEQRKPVMQAINKRLIELKAMEEPKSEETPSLMVQIQNAPDLTALDVLEIDVGSRHPDIQPKLMGYVKKRRFELENGAGPVGAPL